MATIGSETEQVSADPANTVEYSGITFVKLTASTYDVELQNGNKLVIDSEKVINEVEDGVPVSIQGGYTVVDPTPQLDSHGVFTASSYNNNFDYFDPMLYTRDNRVAMPTENYITIDNKRYYDVRDEQNNILTYNGEFLYYTATNDLSYNVYNFVTVSNNTPSQPIKYNNDIIKFNGGFG